MAVSYRGFEERFRGSYEVTREQQRGYLSCFAGQALPVVDLGCGRGEMVELLTTHGHVAYGVESHPEMLEAARERGLPVVEADLLEHLASLPEASLGGVFMAQVIEHVPRPRVLVLCELLASRLAPGGKVVIETLNPQCLFAYAPFYMDFTHRWPVHPLTLEYLLAAHGFAGFETRYQQYVPEDMLRLPQRFAAPDAPQVERDLAEALQKLQIIVDLAFRNFIYALVAERPALPAGSPARP